ncbi:MBL fold metallo-hydrolase [Hydrocarboniphaga sp.]|uniref:MBL fold metallo-hydrolase n=1 Tax=Hydrocarboniphaga sp. TaxID=2033016 RepID=UPI002637B49A|nr:MBL fold metallo-hydrolase [Hydrocarboniphaga sp.]
MKAAAHHTETGFQNPDPGLRIAGDFWRWQRERRRSGVPHPPALGYEAFAAQWSQKPDFTLADDAAPRVWWLGHACVLLRVDGLWVITDPVLSRRASPLSFAGPSRKVRCVVDVAALPAIDVVLISHNHYDHLDSATVRALARRSQSQARATRFLVPLGLASKLRGWGCADVHELDWWQRHEHASLSFDCVPAQHWSARGLFDRNRTLWCGWTVRSRRFGFYFAGDTGYWSGLAEIAKRTGAIDLAALPIGAYAPRWFMQGQHIDPQQAVQLHRELGARHSLAIHWGSFELADDALDEPPQQLQAALAAAGLNQRDFWLLRQGESRAIQDYRTAIDEQHRHGLPSTNQRESSFNSRQ